MEGHAIPRPEDARPDLLLLREPVDQVDPAPEALVVAEVVVEQELYDPARVQQLDGLARNRDLYPTFRCLPVLQIVVEPEADLRASRERLELLSG
jgi:hypothetical protein